MCETNKNLKILDINAIFLVISILMFDAVYVFFAAVKYTNGEDFYFKYLYSVFFLILVQLFVFISQPHKFTDLIKFALIFILFSIGTLVYKDITPLYGISLLICLPGLKIKLKKIIIIEFMFRIILLISVILLWYNGTLIDSQFTRTTESGLIIRHTYGFANPNTFGLFMVSILGEGLYLFWKEKHYILKIIISMFSLYYINLMTDSRSALIVGVLLIILFVCQSILTHFNLKILIFLPLICFIVSTLFAGFLNQSSFFWLKLDSLLSNRLEFNSYFWSTVPKSLFGHKIVQVTNEQALNSYGLLSGRILTNFYLTIFLGFGVVGIVIILYLFTDVLKRLIRNQFYLEVCIFSIYLILGLMENSLLNLFINWSLLLLVPKKLYNDSGVLHNFS